MDSSKCFFNENEYIIYATYSTFTQKCTGNFFTSFVFKLVLVGSITVQISAHDGELRQ